MSASEQILIYKAKGVLLEGLALIGFALFIVSFLTVLDIRFHDFYVLQIVAECYAENQSNFCLNIRELHGLSSTAQIELGNIYWNMLASIGFFVGVTLAGIRLLIAGLLSIYIHRRIRASTIMMALTYGLIGSGLFFFGVLDTFYYWFQGDDVPDSLAWLENAGVFNESKTWTGDPSKVEIMDLYLTNIIGVSLIAFFLFVTMILYASNPRASANGLA